MVLPCGIVRSLVQWQALRGERLGAARNGNRVREALEEALKLDASLADAQFGIGVYQYYADVAPAPAKLLRWFLFLPGGDRVKGLHAIEETSRDGDLMRDEAAFQLFLIDIWYERKPIEAIALLRSLDERYPTNPVFLQRIAETVRRLPTQRAGERGGMANADRSRKSRSCVRRVTHRCARREETERDRRARSETFLTFECTLCLTSFFRRP